MCGSWAEAVDMRVTHNVECEALEIHPLSQLPAPPSLSDGTVVVVAHPSAPLQPESVQEGEHVSCVDRAETAVR